jgi:hypothetical protein
MVTCDIQPVNHANSATQPPENRVATSNYSLEWQIRQVTILYKSLEINNLFAN